MQDTFNDLQHSYEQEQQPEALLRAVDYVLRLYAPGWVREAYAARLGRWERWEVVNLAEAFGVMRDGRKAAEIRKRKSLVWLVIAFVVEARRQGCNREQAIERVAESFKMSEATVRRIYDDHPDTRMRIEHLPTLRFKYPDPE